MKPKNLIIPVLVFGLVFGSLMTSSLAAQKQKKAEQNAALLALKAFTD